MLVKTFRDELAWKIQRRLVKVYFAVREMTQQAEFLDMDTLAAKVASLLSRHIANPMPLGNLVTVEERLRERELIFTPKYRARVRDVAMTIYRERLGRHPFKLTGANNGQLAFEREHLVILDRAIDAVLRSLTLLPAGPLFSVARENRGWEVEEEMG